MRLAVIGTAGHIDHGKTALVRRLTGVDTDRLPEEKKRGISIDLGFAPLVTPGGAHVGIVDVPGHERFVKNMLAGVGGVDLVLLVIAADEVWTAYDDWQSVAGAIKEMEVRGAPA
ncbi:MAG TPA: GTP-binding protein, partial [Verrucomicrobiae bacterium]|nr:GTP-binding protein [Verrucomicrobiae bacterium]